MSNRVAVVNYRLCNLDSVVRALEECGAAPFVTDDPSALQSADRIVLPGVGAFAVAMDNLREAGLVDALTDQVITQGAPFLGICLGMQLLATRGHESGESQGLGWIDADVVRLEARNGERVPHVGWNEVDAGQAAELFGGVPTDTDFYFVHSFHLVPTNENDIAATTPYCGTFVSAIQRDNVFAVQFHPEKSQRHGFQVLRNFLAA